jgi:glycosyltransferase involved in cell wall biosynthesis
MIKVGFGTTVLNRVRSKGGVDGIGTYVGELLNQFSNLKNEIEIHPFSVKSELLESKPLPKNEVSLGNFKAQVLFSSITKLSFLGEKALSDNVDIIHATDHYIPKVSNKPLVATIMDAIPLTHPEWTSSSFRGLKNHFWVETAKWADKIITISDYSKCQISENFKISPEKIISIPLGVDKKWFKKISTESINKVLSKYSINKNFFISVGTLQPRKNVQRVIDAYISLPDHIKKETLLVIIGRSGWGCDEMVANLQSKSYGGSVIWLQHLPEQDLLALVRAAKALVFPSLFEGFGLPVLEAFASGTPVITSNTTSLPEVAGDAALLIDPLDVNAIAQSMGNIIEDGNLASVLVERGEARALDFSWEQTALKTLKVYQNVIHASLL